MQGQEKQQNNSISAGDQLNLSSDSQQSALKGQTNSTSKYISLVRNPLINKSCIQSCSFVNGMHGVVPEVKNPQSVQRLDISGNNIRHLDIANMPNLKQLIANKNKIESLPEQINQLAHLRIVKVNYNRISIIPFLKNIQHLEVNKNPIKLITSQIRMMNAHSIQFDWLQYLIPQASYLNRQDVYKKFQGLIHQIDFTKENNRHFLQFGQIFKVNHSQKSNKNLSSLLHKAIMQKASFFIQYMKSQFYRMDQRPNPAININQLMFLGKPLLEYALQTCNFEAVQLFMLRRRNLNDNDSFILNLELACRYSHIDLFQFLMGSSGKKIIIMGKEMHLISQLLIGFSQLKNSQAILRRILQIHSKHAKGQKIKVKLPINYTAKNIQSISNGLLYILKNPELKIHFTFDQNGEQKQQEPILHFASLSKCPQLINRLIQQGLNPFVRNVYGLPARMMRGSLIGRKIFWNREKKKLKNITNQQNQETQNMQYQYKSQYKSQKKKVPNQQAQIKGLASACFKKQLINYPFNTRTCKSLNLKKQSQRKLRPKLSQIFGLNLKNIPKCLQLLSLASNNQQLCRSPRIQNFITLHPKSNKPNKLQLETPKRQSLQQHETEINQYYENMIYTVKNLVDKYSDIISEEIITKISQFKQVSQQRKVKDCQELISKEGNPLKDYELFQCICNQNTKHDSSIQLNETRRGFLFSPLRLCQQVGNTDQYDASTRKKKIKTTYKQKLTLTQV